MRLKHWTLFLALIALAVISRWLPHLHNFTPVIGLALFSGVRIPNRWLAGLVPLAAMFISDLFLGFHSTMWAVYLTFVVIAVAGAALRVNESMGRVLVGSTMAAVFFFITTNAAVWWTDGMYPLTFSGLIECYVMGIPFFPATLASAWIYSVTLFGLWKVLSGTMLLDDSKQHIHI